MLFSVYSPVFIFITIIKLTSALINSEVITGDDVVSSAEVSVSLKKDRKIEDLYDISLPVISAGGNVVYGNDVVYVESNSILEVELGTNSSTGYVWIILNEEEIDRSEAIDIIAQGTKSNCPNDPLLLGCSGKDVYLFRIWDVTGVDELPVIRMKYARSFESDPKYISEIVLKVRPTSKDCTFNGYKCCSDAKKTVYYHDKDGDWSVENGDWCFIKKDEGDEKENEKEKVKTCTYTGEYPICQKTTKVVYTDTEKWGVENGKWCVLC